MDTAITIVIGVIIAAGVVGTLIPILPGPILVWLATVVYGLLTGFDAVAWISLVVITALLMAAIYLGFRLPQQSAASEGLTLGTQLFAVALAVIGFFLIPIVGAAIGFVTGVWLVRYRQMSNVAAANRSTVMTLKAISKAAIAQFLCALGMAGVWGVWVLTG